MHADSVQTEPGSAVSSAAHSARGRAVSEPVAMSSSAYADARRRRSSKYPPALLERYDIGDTVGDGSFSKVKAASHVLTGRMVAIKVIKKDRLRPKNELYRVRNEIDCLEDLNHPNILSLFQVEQTADHIFLVTEFLATGDLFSYIVSSQKSRITDLSEAAFIFGQVAEAVRFCHARGIAHRDIKPENVLLSDSLTVKLADFGLIARPDFEVTTTQCGSCNYAAPELLKGGQYDGYLSDVWSMGVLLFAMVCGYLPFDEPDLPDLASAILSASYVTPPFVDMNTRIFIGEMLQVDPATRITALDVLEHPWLQQGYKPSQAVVEMRTSPPQALRRTPLDPNLVHALANFYDASTEAMAECVSNWNYDHVTADYLLLSAATANCEDERFHDMKGELLDISLQPHQHVEIERDAGPRPDRAQRPGTNQGGELSSCLPYNGDSADSPEPDDQHTLTPDSSLCASVVSIDKLGDSMDGIDRLKDLPSVSGRRQSSSLHGAVAGGKGRRSGQGRRRGVSMPELMSCSEDNLLSLVGPEGSNAKADATPEQNRSSPGVARSTRRGISFRGLSRRLRRLTGGNSSSNGSGNGTSPSAPNAGLVPHQVAHPNMLGVVSPVSAMSTMTSLVRIVDRLGDGFEYRTSGYRVYLSMVTEETNNKEVKLNIDVCTCRRQEETLLVGVRFSRVKGSTTRYAAATKYLAGVLKAKWTVHKC